MKKETKTNNKALIAEIALIVAIIAVIAVIVVILAGRNGTKKPAQNTPVTTAAKETVSDEDYKVKGPSSDEGLEYDYEDLGKYIRLCDISDVKIQYEKQTPTDEQVEFTIKDLLAQAGEKVAVTDRKSQKGDTLTIKGSGIITESETRFSLNEGTTVLLGEDNGFPEGFDTALYGVSAGETVEFNFVYPQDYSYSNFAGKSVDYNITVEKVEVITPAVLDEKFVASQNIEDVATVDEFREYVKQRIAASVDQQNEQSAQSAILAAVKAASEVLEYPEKELQHYRDAADKECKTYSAAMGMTEDDYKTNNYGSLEAYEQQREESAKEAVKEDLIIRAFAREFGIEISRDEYEKALRYGYEKNGIPNGVSSLKDFEEMNSASLTKGLLTMNVLEALAEKIPH